MLAVDKYSTHVPTKLNGTRGVWIFCNLVDPDFRIAFILDFIALIRHVADGRANVGQLRRPGTVVHRIGKPGDNMNEDDVVKPHRQPWMTTNWQIGSRILLNYIYGS